jgi:hypothetical protein
MYTKNDINNILDAVNEINSITKKNKKNILPTKITIPKLNKDLIIPPDVDKLILEAEKYKKQALFKSSLPTVTSKKTPVSSNEDVLILKNEFLDISNFEKESITLKNNHIDQLQEIEKKLRANIVDLEKDKILLLNKINAKNLRDEQKTPEEYNDYINKTQKTLNFIYEQVKKQKEIFLNLKKHSIKVESDSSVFKENYERLIIENNDIKNRLVIAKDQINKHEENKVGLLSTLNQLNEMLSENNVVRNISPKNNLSDSKVSKNITNLEPVD